MRAYDPTTENDQPINSMYMNRIHYYKIGIGPDEGNKKIWKADDSARSLWFFYSSQTLSNIMKRYLLNLFVLVSISKNLLIFV